MDRKHSHRTDLSDQPELLIFILDVNPLSWAKLKNNVNEVFNIFLAFLNSFVLLHHSNRVCVILSHPLKAEIVYPVSRSEKQKADKSLKRLTSSSRKAEMRYQREVLVQQKSMSGQVISAIKQFSELKLPESNTRSRLAAALSMGLCFYRKVHREFESQGRFINSRILCVETCANLGASESEHVPVMNAIFSARKMGVMIDSLVLSSEKDASFLQQASDLTGGVYHRTANFDGLMQKMIMIFLPGPDQRRYLAMPACLSVDYRANCFCHNKPQDVGWVCPLCLAIHCSRQATCFMCGASYSNSNKGETQGTQ
mmetsp:Transcript_20737/g.50884  ORF Transcript_20737/g.50884 Transcript_20737/m.50884 type:complete len:312 (+) Transcript_20737:201-1136(+)